MVGLRDLQVPDSRAGGVLDRVEVAVGEEDGAETVALVCATAVLGGDDVADVVEVGGRGARLRADLTGGRGGEDGVEGLEGDEPPARGAVEVKLCTFSLSFFRRGEERRRECIPSDGVLCEPHRGCGLAAELTMNTVLVSTEVEDMTGLESK